MSPSGTRLPTWASRPVVSYLWYTGHQINVVGMAARSPTRQNLCAEALELNGRDLRRETIEARKATLAKLLRKAPAWLQLSEHIEEPGDVVFRHACKLGYEGIVSKRLGSPYISGRSRTWLKFKNPAAPAVKREAEEDWGKGR